MDINLENIKSQMRKGMLEYCILSILKNGETYASSLITELKEAKMIVVEGTLYPLLTRLKNQGYQRLCKCYCACCVHLCSYSLFICIDKENCINEGIITPLRERTNSYNSGFFNRDVFDYIIKNK